MQIEKLEAPSSGSEPHLKLYLAKGHHEEAKHLAKTLPYYHYQFANLNSSLPATKLHKCFSKGCMNYFWSGLMGCDYHDNGNDYEAHEPGQSSSLL